MSNSLTPEQQYTLLYAKLNNETAKLPWQELLRHFAAGNVIVVADGIDLIEVAACMASDDTQRVQKWLTEGTVAKVTDAQAQAWLESDASMWTAVVKPWVLVQQHKQGEAYDHAPGPRGSLH
jgi:hypothetical protein